MKADHPDAFRFILQDEIYLLNKDKDSPTAPATELITEPMATAILTETATESPIAIIAEPAKPVITEPEIQQPQPVIKTPEPEFNYMGGNNKNFVILLNYASEEHLPAEHLTALESMLKRKGYELADVAIVNVNRYSPVTLAGLAAAFSPVKLLIMGKDAMPQGIGNLPLNQPVQGKKTNVLYSLSFAEMMSSNDNKKAFWDQMKNL